MNHNFKALVSVMTAALSTQTMATEKEPNPSDLTETNTSAYVSMSNQGDFKASVSGDFHISERQTGMLTLEGTMNKEGRYSDSRLQYFHVFSTDNTTVPRAAVSLDVIDNAMFTSASVGATLAINSGVKGLNLFPRIGVLGGKYSDETTQRFNTSSDDAIGGSAAMYVIYNIGQDGTYIGAWPEYNYMTGDVDASVLKSTLMIATPFSQDKTRWGQIRIENTDVKLSANNGIEAIKSNDTVVWAAYKFYF
ncbi:hypothetical protein [Vibrio agarivorans]|uniref:hypothetical protein n=1 Tax=Vibrio agarivorans TaxID=153622 RepID=UPI00222E6627|nr:hypothetical protein [Vibrio agarivorans]MDN3660578.1 hypothetical protein [Vibrio agarivorans]